MSKFTASTLSEETIRADSLGADTAAKSQTFSAAERKAASDHGDWNSFIHSSPGLSGIYGELSHYFRICQRGKLFTQLPADVSLGLPSNPDELRQAYRLVGKSFFECGYIDQLDDTGMRVRSFELSPRMTTFIAKTGKEVIGVISLIGDSPCLGLPSDSAFNGELQNIRKANLKLCEITNQAVHPEFRRTSVATALMCFVIACSDYHSYQQVFAAVSPGNHEQFYRFLGFSTHGEERHYGKDGKDRVVGVVMGPAAYKPNSWLSPVAPEVQSYMRDTLAGIRNLSTLIASYHRQLTPEFIVSTFGSDTIAGFLKDNIDGPALRNEWGDIFTTKICKLID